MEEATTVQEMLRHVGDAVAVDDSTVLIEDEKKLREHTAYLAWNAVFADGLVREYSRWLLWELGQTVGIYPASINDLYLARGRGETPTSFTVPAMNIRGMNYNTSRAAFRAANALNVGAIIFEIARSEIGYTEQRPAEYISVLLAAAIAEGFDGPLFVQGDHFQVSSTRYKAEPDAEVNAVKALIKEAIEAGFYNIDIDTSTLVDLERETLDEQQRLNYELCAQFSAYARSLEPEEITVSLGGEIGEVGGKNSTVEELHAFMDGYNRTIAAMDAEMVGISKISVQTGTSHGGVVLPDGTLAQVKVDFDRLAELSREARQRYGLGGAVQHGASTLPEDAFYKFPECETVEIHLATGFQNIIYDLVPEEFEQEAYALLKEEFTAEWKEGQTEDQFLYKTRKKVFGPLKREWWSLPDDVQTRMREALEEKFTLLFNRLQVNDTRDLVRTFVTPVEMHRPPPQAAAQETELDIATDLAD